MKKRVRLTESDLHRIVKESVHRIINEIGDSPKGQFMLGRTYGRAEKRGDNDTAIRASNKAWDGSEGGGRNYRNFKNGIDFQNDMDIDKAIKGYKSRSQEEMVHLYHVLPKKRVKNALNLDFNFSDFTNHGKGVYGFLDPKEAEKHINVYGGGRGNAAIVEIEVPSKAVDYYYSRIEGHVGIVRDVNDIYDINIYKTL